MSYISSLSAPHQTLLHHGNGNYHKEILLLVLVLVLCLYFYLQMNRWTDELEKASIFSKPHKHKRNMPQIQIRHELGGLRPSVCDQHMQTLR